MSLISEQLKLFLFEGGVPPGLPKKAFGKFSLRRNELIADLFFRLRKVERVGMGIQKMRKMMKAAGLAEPEFETNGFFRAVFPRLSATPPVTPPADLTSLESKILKTISQNPKISRNQLAQNLGIGLDTVKEYISKLKQKDFLKYVGKTNKGHWEVSCPTP